MGGLHYRRLLTLTAIAACAVFLAACGGADDSSSSSSSDSTAATPSTSGGATSSEETTGDESRSSAPSGEGESNDTGSSSGGSTDEGSSPAPERRSSNLPDRGEVSPQSAEFQQYSQKGELHLAEFGEEASSDDFGEAEEVVVSYLEAAGNQEWDKACAYLSPFVKAQLQELTKASKEPAGDSCGEALSAFAKSPLWKEANGDTPIYASEGISSLRIKKGGLAGGGAGFALFHGSDGEDHWIAIKVEGGGWKVLSTTPQPFL